MDRRQLATQQMQDYDLLRQAMMMQQQQEADFLPTQQRYEDATTARYNKGLMGAGEAIFDAFRRKKVEPQYQQGLAEALAMKGGVDDLKARLEMLQKEREIEEERAYEQSQAEAEHNRKVAAQQALQDKKDAAAMDRTKARGNNPNLTYNIPAGYMPVDPSNPMAGVQPIPGSEQEREVAAAATAAENKQTGTIDHGTHMLGVIRGARSLIGPATTGVIGAAAGQIPGTARKDLLGYITTLQSNQMLEAMDQLKSQAASGATGLGALSNAEGAKLVARIAALDPDQSPAKIQQDLTAIEQHYTRMVELASGKVPGAGASAELPPLPPGFQPD